MASVWVPVLYVLILFGSLFTFGTYYRKRTASKHSPSHPSQIYLQMHKETVGIELILIVIVFVYS